MTRTARIQVKRNAPGSYSIMVDGINRGDVHHVTGPDARWVCNWKTVGGDDDGSASTTDTLREMKALAQNTDWDEV